MKSSFAKTGNSIFFFLRNHVYVFYILKVCFLAKADNSTFHVLEFKKTCLIFVISSDDNVDAWQTLLLLWS